MKVKAVMERPVFIPIDSTKKQILSIVKKYPKTKIFLVADKNKKFLGDIHEDDLFYMMIPNEKYEDIGISLSFDLEKKFFANNAKEIMRKHDITCYEDDDILAASLKFAGAEVNEMPVLNKKNQVVGVITQGILLRNIDKTKND